MHITTSYTTCDPDGNVNTIHWIYWGHCLEILRQELVCRPSVHFYSMVWQEGQLMPFPDFHVQQTCVRWKDFTDMTTQRMTRDDEIKHKMKNIRRPEGAVQRYTPPEGWNVIEQNREWRHKMKEQEVDTKSSR
ncbi:hypothetical protein CLAFUW4_09106 [Fulvia fulva]|uniref:Uncharacterized protein n=1 Tax=Passalora fulva TaxID=5499 RepID=A0A9Q8PH47_PASFU|nr:uncharacterized protein CLAFUR5_09217 [Fulvia fulva]KAK4613846.1 hypothetical protein CLAFUR4_09112 [Fulvia fulva]KAK4614844.1 hypothetical protein CLAFUR0_09104 [Fulvia fulva]UJO22425.1 hypothetical protein CLAFUR5_09217 [Fulvia fulva]WPV20341.1 hypothetical protein CLAFUW4_09106 [Fulvia fulva]WPV35296.1 hypothetical protein CLAFUW7_09107 [Fulvia fulva]